MSTAPQKKSEVLKPQHELQNELHLPEMKFSVGQVVVHAQFGYRGVVIRRDDHFKGDHDWYENVAKSKSPKDRPWYHILVDGSNSMTYVAEKNLVSDRSLQPISHPMTSMFFDRFENGRYGRNLH